MDNLLVSKRSSGIIVTQRQKVFKSQTFQLPFQATTFLLHCITTKNDILSFFANIVYIFNDKISCGNWFCHFIPTNGLFTLVNIPHFGSSSSQWLNLLGLSWWFIRKYYITFIFLGETTNFHLLIWYIYNLWPWLDIWYCCNFSQANKMQIGKTQVLK
jgi:hypothetical protein